MSRKVAAGMDGVPVRRLFLVLCVAIATVVGLRARVPFLLPLLQGAVAWPFFVAEAASGRVARALGCVLLIALTAGVLVPIEVVYGSGLNCSVSIPGGVSYRDSMFAFIRSGGIAGQEAYPKEFLPVHALHFGGFVVLCAATAGLGALVLGAVLLDYMSFYVGALVLEAQAHGSVGETLLRAWAPYAIIRVFAYAITAAGIASLCLGPVETRLRARGAILVGTVLAILDVILKTILARSYGESLLSSTGM